jgi:hypothetical protein
VRRDADGQFTEDQVAVGKSSAADQRQHSKTPARQGQGTVGTARPDPIGRGSGPAVLVLSPSARTNPSSRAKSGDRRP